jgi:hypothetical protein
MHHFMSDKPIHQCQTCHVQAIEKYNLAMDGWMESQSLSVPLQVVSERVDKPRNIEFKGATDLVTDTDKASEEAVLSVSHPSEAHVMMQRVAHPAAAHALLPLLKGEAALSR